MTKRTGDRGVLETRVREIRVRRTGGEPRAEEEARVAAVTAQVRDNEELPDGR